MKKIIISLAIPTLILQPSAKATSDLTPQFPPKIRSCDERGVSEMYRQWIREIVAIAFAQNNESFDQSKMTVRVVGSERLEDFDDIQWYLAKRVELIGSDGRKY